MIFSLIKNKFAEQGVFVKHSLILFSGTILINFFNYIFHLVIGRMVDVEIYGEAESLISLVAIISVFSATLTMIATKYSAACKAENDKEGSRQIRSYLNRKIFKYGLPIFAFSIFLTPIVGNFLNIENNFALVLIWITMFLSFFSAVNSGTLSGWQKFRYISLNGILGAAIKLISGIVLVKIGFALNGIVGSFVLGSFVTYFASVAVIRLVVLKKKNTDKIEDNKPASFDFGEIKKFILPVFVGNLAITLMCNMDMVLAKHNLDAIAAGQYGALNVASKVIYFVTGIVASVLFSMSSESNHKGDSAKPLMKIGLALVFFAGTFATIIYFLYPELILSILYGNKYQGAAAYLGWFAIAVSLFSIVNLIFQYLLSIHKTKIAYFLIAIAAVFSGLIFLYGKSISAIINIVIIMQFVAILIGLFFVSRGKLNEKV